MAISGSSSGPDRPELRIGLQRCIWMTAGVISYKLCPLDFNCDGCEFDSAMRKMQTVAASAGNNRPPANPQS